EKSRSWSDSSYVRIHALLAFVCEQRIGSTESRVRSSGSRSRCAISSASSVASLSFWRASSASRRSRRRGSSVIEGDSTRTRVVGGSRHVGSWPTRSLTSVGRSRACRSRASVAHEPLAHEQVEGRSAAEQVAHEGFVRGEREAHRDEQTD